MIRLERETVPPELSLNAARWTVEFATTGKTVWNTPALKDALMRSSHRKCAYCECNLSTESNYMEVEHFADKDRYPKLVVEWKNLLPSCKRCNGAKSTHDVVREPIVNPYDEDPRDHLRFSLYRFRPISPVGGNTIDVVDLNNPEKIVQVRFEIGEAIQDSIEEAVNKLRAYEEDGSVRRRNKLIGNVKAILLECQPSSSYAGTAATVLVADLHYIRLTESMNRLGLWDSELQRLHANAAGIAYDQKTDLLRSRADPRIEGSTTA